MKRAFLCALALLLACAMNAQTPKAPLKGTIVTMGSSGTVSPKVYNRRGNLPPKWLRNVVTPEQYDTLAMLNMVAAVNYDMFKGYNISRGTIAANMTGAQRALQLFTTDPAFNRKTTNTYGGASTNCRLKPISETRLPKNGVTAKYIAYSSINGYDAHVVLTATLLKDKKTGSYTAAQYTIEGLSLGGATVTCNLKMTDVKTKEEARQVVINNDLLSAHYHLHGTIEFTDPLGNRHRERINQMMQLELAQP